MGRRKRRQRRGRSVSLAPPSSTATLPPPGPERRERDAGPTNTRVFAFDAETLEEHVDVVPEDIADLRRPGRLLWVDVDGLSDAGTVEAIGAAFGLPYLAIEDALIFPQRPKVEFHDAFAHCVVRMATFDERLDLEQIAVYWGEGFVLTVQQKPGGDCLDPVRARLRNSQSRLRGKGTDFLAHRILDTIVDHYYPVFESIGEQVESLEQDIVQGPSEATMGQAQDLRTELLVLRRSVWPLPEVFDALVREDESPWVSEEARAHFRDTLDHAKHLVDVYETCRDATVALADTYRSAVTLKTNEVMRYLTIITALFMPVTFIAGVYGMNFAPEASPLNMPELSWYVGYPFALGLMVLASGSFVLYLRRRGWLGDGAGSDR